MISKKSIWSILGFILILLGSFPLGLATGRYFSLDNRLRRTAYHYIEKYYLTGTDGLVDWTEGVVSEVGQPFSPDIVTTLIGKGEKPIRMTERPPMYEITFNDPARSGTLGGVSVWVLKKDFSFVGFMPRE